MPPTRRTRYEQDLRQHFATQGCGMVRSAGSKGSVDVIAHDATVVRWIQVKSTESWAADNKFPTRLADAVAALLALCLPPETNERWLYVHVHRQGWFTVRVDGWRAGRIELLARVHGVLRAWQAGVRIVEGV